MNNQKTLYIIGGIIALATVGYIVFGRGNATPQQSQPVISAQTEVPSNTADVVGSSEFEKRFVAYSPENLASATQNGRAVIFFHASWCPSCVAAEADLKANFDKVPPNVMILKTDYDSSKELKGKYGVVSQDTWVQVDSQGKTVTKWNSGGKGLTTLLANLK